MTHGLGSLRTWHWCLLGLWWRPQAGSKGKEASIGENLQPITKNKALIHSWWFHPYHLNISTPHHSPLQHHCMEETVAHWSLSVDHIHRRALGFPYALRQLWTFSGLLPEKKAWYSSVVHGLKTAWFPLHMDQWWPLSTKLLNPGLGKVNPQLDLTLPYHVLQGSLLCIASCTSIMIQHSRCLVYRVTFPSATWYLSCPVPSPSFVTPELPTLWCFMIWIGGIRAVTVLKPIPHLDILLLFLVN